MNFQKILQQREVRLREARLANLAFAYSRLRECAARMRRAGLAGPLAIDGPDPESDRHWPVLVSRSVAPAVIDEHFLDEDVMELSDVFAFLRAEGESVEDVFSLGSLEHTWLPRLRTALQRAGVSGLEQDDETPRRPERDPAAAGDRPDGTELG